MLRLNTSVMPGSAPTLTTPRGPAATTASGALPWGPDAVSDRRNVALGGTRGAAVWRQLTRPAAMVTDQRTLRGNGFCIGCRAYQLRGAGSSAESDIETQRHDNGRREAAHVSVTRYVLLTRLGVSPMRSLALQICV